MELALFSIVLWLRFPKMVLSPSTPFWPTRVSISWPLGQPLRPRANIKYHFSKARSQREAVISDSSRVNEKSITSWYDPRMCSTRATRWDGCEWENSSSMIGTGYKIGVGTIGSSSPMTRRMPGDSQGMATVNTGGVAAHTSPLTLLRFNASSSQPERGIIFRTSEIFLQGWLILFRTGVLEAFFHS